MGVPEKRPRVDADSCMHQCTKCGLMYDCGDPRCDRPYYSGVCAQDGNHVCAVVRQKPDAETF